MLTVVMAAAIKNIPPNDNTVNMTTVCHIHGCPPVYCCLLPVSFPFHQKRIPGLNARIKKGSILNVGVC